MLYNNNGQIEFERAATDRRIISKERLVKYLQDKGLLVNDILCTKYDVVYAGVSTHKQKERGELDRQVELLLAFTANKNPKNLIVLKEVGSGLNDNRKKLAGSGGA